MIVKGVKFQSVLLASGAKGFFDEGYQYHEWLKAIFRGFDFNGTTFVAKTTTLYHRAGNMPLQDNLRPTELIPRCIFVSPKSWWHGAAINAVSLSGPGAEFLLSTGNWQARKKPFWISFMSVATTRTERLLETKLFIELLMKYLGTFHAPFGLQINFSCPNAGLNPQDLVAEVLDVLAMAEALGIPIMLKFNVATAPELLEKIVEHPACHSLCVSNALPWEKVDDGYKMKVFGSTESPLKRRGFEQSGGLSGRYLFPRVVAWVKEARAMGIDLPINAGGGILHPDDVYQLREAGANSIMLGSCCFLRPWRVRGIIARANELFYDRD